jgi:acetyl esterase/lipase
MFAKFQFVCLFLPLFYGGLLADDETIYLWPLETPANPVVHQQDEFVENRATDQNELGLNRSYSFVSKPTMTIFPAPKESNSGVAVIVFPGGGYSRVVIDKEGNDIARILNNSGISAFVVKYSTYPTGFRNMSRDDLNKIKQTVLEDAQQAVRIVRSGAKKWGVNPAKIGAMGFSAGGNLTYRLATHYDNGIKSDSPILSASCKVDFAAPMYPALRDGVVDVDTETPPMFVVVANDDKTTPADQSITLISALRKNGVSAELHIFSKGGHGFGEGVKGGAVGLWPSLFVEWLKDMQILEHKDVAKVKNEKDKN